MSLCLHPRQSHLLLVVCCTVFAMCNNISIIMKHSLKFRTSSECLECGLTVEYAQSGFVVSHKNCEYCTHDHSKQISNITLTKVKKQNIMNDFIYFT